MFILSCVDIEFKCVQLGVYTVLTSTPLGFGKRDGGGWTGAGWKLSYNAGMYRNL